MSTWSILPVLGLSLMMAGSPISEEVTGSAPCGNAYETATGVGATGMVRLGEADADRLADVERSCTAPIWGQSEACAAFTLAAGASVNITLKEVLDTSGGKISGDKITFRLYDVKGQKTVDSFDLSVGSTHPYTNSTQGVLDLVIHVRGPAISGDRIVRFTYSK